MMCHGIVNESYKQSMRRWCSGSARQSAHVVNWSHFGSSPTTSNFKWSSTRHYGLCLRWWVQGDCAPYADTMAVCLKSNTLDVHHKKPSFALSAVFGARLPPCLCWEFRAFRCVELTTCCKAQTEPVLLLRGEHILPMKCRAYYWTCASSTACQDLDAAWSWAGVWSYNPGQGFVGHSQFQSCMELCSLKKQGNFSGPWQPQGFEGSA